MTITKPSTLSLVAAGAMLLAFIGTLLPWWRIELIGTVGIAGTDYSKGVLVLLLSLLALALFVATLFIAAFPENIQMPLLGTPIFQAALAVPALLLTLVGFIDSGTANLVDASRGIGLFLTLIGVVVWGGVTAVQAKPLLEAAQAMKAAPAAPPAPETPQAPEEA